MPKKIVSFGFRHTILLDVGSIEDRSIDVRKYLTRNPYHNKALRGLRGDNPLVIEDIEKTPNIERSYAMILDTAKKCNGILYIGCTGGHHRSVYIANRLGKDLGVEVEHRDYDRR